MLGIKESFLNLIRGTYEKPIDNITLHGEILNSFLVVEFGRRMATLTTSFQFCSVGL